MPTSDIIATTELTCIRPTGERLDCLVEIGKPYQVETGEWACALSLGELYPGLPEVSGEDSLQALCLALSLTRQLLTHFIEDGGRISYIGTGPDSDFDLGACFSRIGPSS
jgi:hypothetical protein